MFCPKCKSLMFPKNGKLVCKRCSTEKEITRMPNVKYLPKEKELKIISPEDEQTLPKTRVLCSKCSNTEAMWFIRQMRASDEPETKFYICTKCKYTWREDL